MAIVFKQMSNAEVKESHEKREKAQAAFNYEILELLNETRTEWCKKIAAKTNLDLNFVYAMYDNMNP